MHMQATVYIAALPRQYVYAACDVDDLCCPCSALLVSGCPPLRASSRWCVLLDLTSRRQRILSTARLLEHILVIETAILVLRGSPHAGRKPRSFLVWARRFSCMGMHGCTKFHMLFSAHVDSPLVVDTEDREVQECASCVLLSEFTHIGTVHTEE
jgi:hypothetical protein